MLKIFSYKYKKKLHNYRSVKDKMSSKETKRNKGKRVERVLKCRKKGAQIMQTKVRILEKKLYKDNVISLLEKEDKASHH